MDIIQKSETEEEFGDGPMSQTKRTVIIISLVPGAQIKLMTLKN